MLVLPFMATSKCVWLFQRFGGFEGELWQHPLRPQLRTGQDTAGVQVHMWLTVSFCHAFILKLQLIQIAQGFVFWRERDRCQSAVSLQTSNKRSTFLHNNTFCSQQLLLFS